MVTEQAARIATVFGAVADPTRRAILDILRKEELSAGALARRFPVSRPAVSRHLRVLRSAGLVKETRRAQSRLYSLEPGPLREVDRWLSDYRIFWAARLQDLKRFVERGSRRK
jgi:DNA-binding transcriptional ArsR family regulator